MAQFFKKLYSFNRAVSLRLVVIQLFVILAMGTTTSVLIPPFQTPDEHGHYMAEMTRIQKVLASKQPNCYLFYGFPEFFKTTPIAFHYQTKFSTGIYENIHKM